MRDHVLSQ